MCDRSRQAKAGKVIAMEGEPVHRTHVAIGCPSRNPHPWSGRTIVKERISDVEFAAYFVARQPGGVERILRRHHPMPNGLCAGCVATPTMHPCQAARIAEMARQRADYRAPTPAVEIVRQPLMSLERPTAARGKSRRKLRRR
jgi:hypothetical protein